MGYWPHIESREHHGLYHVRTEIEATSLGAGNWPSLDAKSPNTLILDIMRKKLLLLLSHLVMMVYHNAQE